MVKYILILVLVALNTCLSAQTQVDSINVKKILKLNGKRVTAISNDANLTAKDSNALITDYAAKSLIKNETDPVWIADKPNYPTTAAIQATYPPFSGAGAYGIWNINALGYSTYLNKVTRPVWFNGTDSSGILVQKDTAYTGYNSVLTQSKASALYQPLENQRLSTFNIPTFAGATLTGQVNMTNLVTNSTLISTGNNSTANLLPTLQSRKVATDTLTGIYINPTITKDSADFNAGLFISGNGSGQFATPNSPGYILTGQSGLTNGTYNNVPTTSTRGSNATLNVTVTGTSPSQVVVATVANGGSGYFDGDTVIVQKTSLGGASGTIAFLGGNITSYSPLAIQTKSNSNFNNKSFTLTNYYYNATPIGSIYYNPAIPQLSILANNYLALAGNIGITINNATTFNSSITQVRASGQPYFQNDYLTQTSKYTAGGDINAFNVNSSYSSGVIASFNIIGGSGYRDSTAIYPFTTSGIGTSPAQNAQVTTSGGAVTSVNFYPYGSQYGGVYNFAVGDTVRFVGLPAGSGAYVIVTSVTPANTSYNGYTYTSTIADSATALPYNNYNASPQIKVGSKFTGEIRGYYFNPTITQVGLGTVIGFENKTGNNYLNSGGGKTGIGYTSAASLPKLFNVKGSINFNKDSIAIAPNTKWKLAIDSATGNIVRDSTGGTGGGVTFDSTITALSDTSGTITVNCNNQSQKSFYVILTGTNRTVTFINAVQNGVYTIQIFQDATGGRTITTWTNGKYPGQTIPTQTSAANAQDIAVVTFKNGYYYIHYNNNY